VESHIDADDLEAVSEQLGRPLRGVVEVAHRCTCGKPDVVKTLPRLPDGTPFPTLYYLTCPRATGAVSTLEAQQVMKDMETRLAEDADLRHSYRQAHDAYLKDRHSLGEVPEIEGISAGGMPERVKCLHVLVAHSLAVGPGVNPLGDQALAMLADWGQSGPCTREESS
jgi:uncharacterized protein